MWYNVHMYAILYQTWSDKYYQASIALENREEYLDRVSEEIELVSPMSSFPLCCPLSPPFFIFFPSFPSPLSPHPPFSMWGHLYLSSMSVQNLRLLGATAIDDKLQTVRIARMGGAYYMYTWAGHMGGHTTCTRGCGMLHAHVGGACYMYTWVWHATCTCGRGMLHAHVGGACYMHMWAGHATCIFLSCVVRMFLRALNL